jgi:uncharacterized protein YjbI with pentapeptide repeats
MKKTILIAVFLFLTTLAFADKNFDSFVREYKEGERKFIKYDFARSDFIGQAFPDCRFEECQFDDAILDDCVMTGVVFDRCSLKGFSCRNVNWEKGKILNPEGREKWDVRGANMKNFEFVAYNLTACKFDRAVISDSQFSPPPTSNSMAIDESSFIETDLQGCTFVKVWFRRADFSGVKAEKAVFRECEIDGKLTGGNFKGAKIRMCHFLRDTDFSRAVFQNADLRKSRFDHYKMDFTETNFVGANLSGSEIANGQSQNDVFDFSTADFRNANLEDIRFNSDPGPLFAEGAEIRGIKENYGNTEIRIRIKKKTESPAK